MAERSFVLSALLWGLLSFAAAPIRASFDRCGELLSADPASEAVGSCFFTAARETAAYEEAAHRLEEAVARHPDAPWLSFYLANVLMMARPCTGAAEERYRRARELFAALIDPENETRAQTSLAFLLARCAYADPAYLEEAGRELSLAAEMAELSLDPLAVPRVELTRLRLEIKIGGELEAVHRRLQRLWSQAASPALDGLETVESLRREVLRALGQVSFNLGRYDEARLWYGRRRARARATGNARDELAASYDRLICRVAGDLPSEANRGEIYEELVALLPRAEELHASATARLRLLIGKMEGGARGAAELERCVEQAGAGEVDDRTHRRCLLALAAHRLEGDPAAARALLDRAYAEGLFPPEKGPAFADAWQDHLQVVWATHSREEAEVVTVEILDAIEALRARQVDLARGEILQAWSDAYYWAAGRMLQQAPGDRELRRSFAIVERLRAQALREVLATGSEVGRSPSLPPPPPDLLDRVVERLGPREAMLSFQLAPWRDLYGDFGGGSWVLVTTAQGTRAHRLEKGRVKIEPAVEMLIDASGDWPESLLNHLYDALLAPALSTLPADVERLVLIPDGILHLLPFAALRAAPGVPSLAERWEISAAPSAALWLSWREAEAALPPSALVLADPQLEVPGEAGRLVAERSLGPHDRYASLPFARREGRRIVRHLGRGSRLLDGAAASESFLREADLAPFGLLHLAAHAEADAEQPWRSRVLLASGGGHDGWLQPAEIAGLALDGKTVVLSTCDSAAGGWLRGEGAMTLARAFFEGGAHAVVATLRPLPDEDAADFFEDFYGHLGRGLSLRQALAASQRRWIADRRPMTTWASVVILGDGDRVHAPGGADSSRTPLRWILSVVAALLVSASLVLRRRSS